ncbi:hypothetical protein TNCV_1171011 [Trichonephila clavipes]|nr:hypothetical protein TNCV_1171011 [Trichonephila clavipes]
MRGQNGRDFIPLPVLKLNFPHPTNVLPLIQAAPDCSINVGIVQIDLEQSGSLIDCDRQAGLRSTQQRQSVGKHSDLNDPNGPCIDIEAQRASYLVHFLPNEEIAIVVEHQDRQNQLKLVTSYSLGRPVLFPLQRQPVVSKPDDTT